MHHAPPLMGENHKHKEAPKRYCGHGKEIEGHEVLHVVCEERLSGR
jgi:hypothetical protein